MRDLIMSLASSVIAGSAVWLAQRLLRYRRLARMRAFFGVSREVGALLVAPRHFSSPLDASIHRNDMAAMVAVAAIVNACGAGTEIADQHPPRGLGRNTEFCVGGPGANPRTAAHLRAFLPGIRFDAGTGGSLSLTAGDTIYQQVPEQAEYGVLARVDEPGMIRPVFLIAGQTSRTNLAAARLLAGRYRSLLRSHGPAGRFCLVLRIREPEAFGADLMEVVADVTDAAFEPPEAAAADPALPPAAPPAPAPEIDPVS